MIRQDNHHNHPRHDQSQSKTIIPLPSDTFHDKLFPIDQRDVLINSIVLLVQVVPRFWHSSGSCRRNTFDAPLRSLDGMPARFDADNQPDKIIITIILDMIKANLKTLFPSRRTPFMISSFHLAKVMY